MKPITLNSILYDYVHEGVVYESIDDYKDHVP